MKVVLKNEQVCVIDDLLPAAEFNRLWQGLQTEPFERPHAGGRWIKVWRLTGGTPLKGVTRNSKTGDYMDAAWDAFEEVRNAHPGFVAKTNLSLTSYIYPPGTKLDWHSDEGYGGAFTYYCHPRWSATWGGELLVALTPKWKQTADGLDQLGLHHAWQDEFLLGEGHGLYIACKPNRLVLQKQGVWHAINRVDSDAGNNLRVSIVGFFQKAEVEPPAEDSAQASEAAETVGLETVLQKAPGLSCRVILEGESASIEFAGKRVQGPAAIGPALQYAAAAGRFPVRALPDGLTDNGKVVLARHLVREGLLRPDTNPERSRG